MSRPRQLKRRGEESNRCDWHHLQSHPDDRKIPQCLDDGSALPLPQVLDSNFKQPKQFVVEPSCQLRSSSPGESAKRVFALDDPLIHPLRRKLLQRGNRHACQQTA
jgi:hypothetical protein